MSNDEILAIFREFLLENGGNRRIEHYNSALRDHIQRAHLDPDNSIVRTRRLIDAFNWYHAESIGYGAKWGHLHNLWSQKVDKLAPASNTFSRTEILSAICIYIDLQSFEDDLL